jgi:photosystem II stability/assembly factor-like uncharacterized protein
VWGQDLWETRDGGNSWKPALNLPIKSMTSSSGRAWAIVNDCPSQPCLSLYTENLAGGSGWVKAATQPAMNGADAQILDTSDLDAWILVWNGAVAGSSGVGSQLLVTHDGGSTWQALVQPCANATSLDDEMAMRHDGTLWIICGGQSAAGSEEKQLITSSDGGLHWNFPPNLSLAGHVSQFTLLSATSGWAAFNQGQAYVTTDGGQHWTAAGSRGLPVDGAGAGFQGLQFIGQQGWVANGTTLYRTSDGGAHWSGAPFVMVTP